MDKSKRSNLNVKSLVIVFLIAAVAWYPSKWFFSHISRSPTHSDPQHHFFWMSKDPQKIASVTKGDYIIFPHSTRIIDNCYPSCHLTKKIVCAPGDVLSAHDHIFTCNGSMLGQSLTHNKHKVPVTSFEYEGRIPDGKFFVMCPARDSYDSRYFGLVDKSNVQAVARPLF